MPVSDEVRTEIREQYELFEKGNGMDTRDLRAFMKVFGVELNDVQLDKLVNECDPGSSGSITLGAVLSAFDRMLSVDAFRQEEIETAFKVFDRHNDGVVTVSDLSNVLTQYGQRFTEGELNELLHSAQANAAGHFNYRDFIRKTMSA